jgi:hypothetical protein
VKKGLRPALAVLAALSSLAARGDDTQVLPQGVFVLDLQYAHSRLDKEWGNDRRAHSLIDDIPRYEPGGGLQGTVTARPVVTFDWAILQLLYGATDQLSVGAIVPIVLRTRVDANLGWRSGDYSNQLGRTYSQDDFWQWAQSMGQPRPADHWQGNEGTLADLMLAARWRFADRGLFQRLGVTAAVQASVTLPTGRNGDPEELIAVGTGGWEVHTVGDAELHLSAKKALLELAPGVDRLAIGADVYGAWLRPRTYQTPRGTKNPLLLDYQPYVGDTYVIDGGDWLAASLVIDAALLAGPTRATRVSGNDLAKAEALPPLLALTASYTYLATGQTTWRSDSALWSYEREKHWGPGEKNIFRANATVSLLRLGLPLQLYGLWRSQELIPGRNTRPSSVVGGGIRLFAKFW